MRDCADYDIMLSARLDGELSEEEDRELEEHLAVCPECRKYLLLLETVRDGLREELPAPPDALRQGVMYKIGLEKKRGRLVYTAFGRWTAIAAILCVVIFGAVKLQNSGLKTAANETAVRSAETVAGGSYAVKSSADSAAPAEAPAAENADFSPAEAPTAAGLYQDSKYPAPAATAATGGVIIPDALINDRDEAAWAESNEEEGSDSGVDAMEPLASPPGSVYAVMSLPGYDVGRAALSDGDYRSVCIFYDELPESVSTEKWLSRRTEEGELARWLVSAEELHDLETRGGWNEFYYGDLSSGQGLVIVIADEEE